MSERSKQATEVFWLSKQRRTTFLSVAGGLFGAAWILLHSPRAAQVLAPQTLPADGMTSRDLRSSGEVYGNLEKLGAMPQREAIYLANLACRTGDYVVSVRRVNSLRCRFDSNLPYGVKLGASEPLRVSLQVMSARTGRIARIDHINTELTVVDSTGKRLPLAAKGDAFLIPNGIGCMFQIPAPSDAAEYLRSIDGVIHILPNASLPAVAPRAGEGSSPALSPSTPVGRQTLPFHIANVPLPWKLRVFGLVGAAVLDDSTAREVHLIPGAWSDARPITIQGPQMEQVLKRLPLSAFQTALRPPQPNQLTLAQNIPNVTQLSVPAPTMTAGTARPTAQALPLICALTPQVSSAGFIKADVHFEGVNAAPLNVSLATWDNAPVLLAVPASRVFSGRGAGEMLMVYLDLHLDKYPPDSLFNGEVPKQWRPKKGEAGGALSGAIVTDRGAFGLGRAKLTVRRVSMDGTGKSKPVNILVAVDRDGIFNLSNVAAGRYQVELEESLPYRSLAVAPGSFEEFLSQRLGMRQAKVDSGAKVAVVKAGDRVELPPWVFHETKQSAGGVLRQSR